MKTKYHRTRNGFDITVQRINDKISHIIICDYNLYSDEDSRSHEIWRTQGLVIPVNNDKDLKQIKKLFKHG